MSLILNNKHIRRLSLKHCNNLDSEPLLLNDEPIESLEKFIMHECSLPMSEVAKIIKVAPNLFEFELHGDHDLRPLAFDDKVVFKKLKKFDFQSNVVDLNALNNLLLDMPELESLTLFCTGSVEGMPLTLEVNSLSKLTSFQLLPAWEQSLFSKAQVSSLLNAAPNLDRASRELLINLHEPSDLKQVNLISYGASQKTR